MARRIVVDPTVHFGQPCIEGTRIPVYAVLELVQAGIPFSEIVQDYYPELSVEDVSKCVEYAVQVIKAEQMSVPVAPSPVPRSGGAARGRAGWSSGFPR